jgi:hypothetical protein
MLKDKDVAIAKINSIIWNTSTPYESAGWPPGMLDHVKSIMQHLALDVIDSIYTEDELDSRINGILFEKP